MMGWNVMADTVCGERIHPTKSRDISADPTREFEVFRHDRDAFRMERSEIRVFENTHKVGFGSFLDRHDGSALEPKIGTVGGRHLTNQTLEWRFSNQQIGRFLVLPDLAERDGSRPEPVRLLDAPLGQGKRLGAERGPHTRNRFARDLLDARHILVALN
jgi:hypothetical protein